MSGNKRTEQFLRAADAKPPGYEELVERLEDVKRHASEKHIPDRQVQEAIRSVFGDEEKPLADE